MDTKTYDVSHCGRLDDEPVPVGRVSIDPGLQVRIETSEGEFAEQLAQAVRTLNGRQDIYLHASPDDPGSRAITKRLVSRDSAEAPSALLEALREGFGFELTPTQ